MGLRNRHSLPAPLLALAGWSLLRAMLPGDYNALDPLYPLGAIGQGLTLLMLTGWVGLGACVDVRKIALGVGWVVFGIVLIEQLFRAGQGLNYTSVILGNANTTAMMIAPLLPVGLYTLAGRYRIAWGVLGSIALLATGSRGAVFAVILAQLLPGGVLEARLKLNYKDAVTVMVFLSGAIVGFHKIGLSSRDVLAGTAIEQFLSSPVWGRGPGSFWFVRADGWETGLAHNYPLTIAAELGLIGLALLAWVVVWVWRRRGAMPSWAWSGLVIIALHSMSDEPLRFWGSGLLAALYLSQGRVISESGSQREQSLYAVDHLDQMW